MEVKAFIRVISLLAMSLVLQSCATVGNSPTDTDFSIYPRFYVDEYVEILRAGYFTPSRYWAREEPKRELLMKLTGSDKNFRHVRAMKYMMTEDIDEGRFEYYKVYFYIPPGVKVHAEKGVFLFSVALDDSMLIVHDEGLCVRIRGDIIEPHRRVYWDSGDGVISLHDKLAEDRPPGWPVPAYVRLPAWVEKGEIKGFEIDPELWIYSGPGVKEKPRSD